MPKLSRDGCSAAGASMCSAPNGSRSPFTANGAYSPAPALEMVGAGTWILRQRMN